VIDRVRNSVKVVKLSHCALVIECDHARNLQHLGLLQLRAAHARNHTCAQLLEHVNGNAANRSHGTSSQHRLAMFRSHHALDQLRSR
jgi:hypothetical protein